MWIVKMKQKRVAARQVISAKKMAASMPIHFAIPLHFRNAMIRQRLSNLIVSQTVEEMFLAQF